VSTKDIKATVFIPTYNGEEFLEDIFVAIFKQKVDFNYEVLVIDSGSKDKTIEIIRKFEKKHSNLRFIEIDNSEFGHGKTRNYAAKLAKGEFIAYLSHDAIPAHNRWLYEMIKPFEIHEKIVGVMGRQIPRPKCVPLLKYEINAVFKSFGPEFGTTLFYKDDFIKNRDMLNAVSFYSDVNSATRRAFLLDVIPYRDVRYSEDQMFGEDVIEAGYYKVYAPRGSVEHSNEITLRDYKHRMFDETMGLRKVGKKIATPSIKGIVKSVVVGSAKDGIRTVLDKQYSFKRKAYWLVMNPFYHIEKWRGVRLATRTHLNDTATFDKNSLEKRRKN